MVSHAQVLQMYIESETSPSGEWWLEVPVGFDYEDDATITMGAMKAIDAVCFTSREDQPPQKYQFESTGLKFTHGDRLIQPRHYRKMWGNREFADESAAIIEVKSGKPTIEGIGQLVAYSELIREDWSVEVEKLVLIGTRPDPLVERVCDNLGIEIELLGEN